MRICRLKDEVLKRQRGRMCLITAITLFCVVIPVSIYSSLSNRITSAHAAKYADLQSQHEEDLLHAHDLHQKYDHFYIHHWPDPVNVRNGNLLLYYQDLHIPFFNISIDIIRVYNSRAIRIGSFGYGWTSNFDTRLELVDDNKIKVFEPSGATTIYSKELVPTEKNTFISSTRKSKILYLPQKNNYLRIRNCGYSEIFNSNGLLLKWQDRDGHFIQYVYEKNRLKQIQDTAGRKVILSHTEEGFVSKIVDPDGRIFRYFYDDSNNLIKMVRPGQTETKFSYDKSHNLTGIALSRRHEN